MLKERLEIPARQHASGKTELAHFTDGEAIGLDLRKGLPDAPRVLLREYSRAGLEADVGYNGLIRFWMDRHMMFRHLLGRLHTQAEDTIDRKMNPAAFRQQTAQLGTTFVQELHRHHGIEDAHYFPVSSGKDTRIAQAFELLHRDHHALDGHLNRFVATVNQPSKRKLQVPSRSFCFMAIWKSCRMC